MMRLTVGSLFSGIGGFDLGLERAGFQIAWQVENNAYCRKVLRKHWPGIPCHYDITTIDWRNIPTVDLVCGGFPCQPFSCAGKRRGKADDRYLWPEVVRCLETLRPAWFLGENVPGIVNLALDTIITDLEGLGYAVWPVCLPACAVDAPHQRQRLWIVAHAESTWKPQPKRGQQNIGRRTGHSSQDVADAEREQSSGGCDGIEWRERGQTSRSRTSGKRGRTANDGWLPEPDVGGTLDGFSRWLDRYGGLNGASKMEFAAEAVYLLWDLVLSQAARVGTQISAEAVLLAFVCKLKNWRFDETRLLLASQEVFEAELRGMRYNPAKHCPSCRSRHSQQHARQHPDFVQVVSRFLARHSEKAWIAYRRSNASSLVGWETGFARVSSGVTSRVDRLRGLGNAIVPQIAETLGKMILEVHYDLSSM